MPLSVSIQEAGWCSEMARVALLQTPPGAGAGGKEQAGAGGPGLRAEAPRLRRAHLTQPTR